VINVKNELYLKAFGKHLKKLRELQSISQENLATDAGIGENQIGLIEQGKINPTISTVNAIAIALNLPPKQLFDF
jgi:transcriptional regulator with XRE-family HTH domain